MWDTGRFSFEAEFYRDFMNYISLSTLHTFFYQRLGITLIYIEEQLRKMNFNFQNIKMYILRNTVLCSFPYV